MILIERLEHFEKQQKDVGNEYGAEVLYHARKAIESLRNVARAARKVNGELLHDIYEDPDLHALDTALAQLPEWLLENE